MRSFLRIRVKWTCADSTLESMEKLSQNQEIRNLTILSAEKTLVVWGG